MKKLAFIGYGVIGRTIREELAAHSSEIEILGAFDPYLSDNAECMRIFESMDELMDAAPNLVVEAASQSAVSEYVPALLSHGIDVVSLSVGAYLRKELIDRIKHICSLPGSGNLHIPSGALPSLDVVQSAKLRGLKRAELLTTKPPKALLGAPGFAMCSEEIERLQEPVTVFEGSAFDAVLHFPQNINVAAALNLVLNRDGEQETLLLVKIVADPRVSKNHHRVTIEGDFGRLVSEIECEQSSNPKTSLIAPLSASALVLKLARKIKIGT